MDSKSLDAILNSLYGKAARKKDIALVKAEAEKDAICREWEAYVDGADDAIKAVKAAMEEEDNPELLGGAEHE